MRAVHERDGYPTHWPADPEAFAAGDRTLAAWVAELDGTVVGQVVLADCDEAHAFAPWRTATGVEAGGLGLIARLFVAADARGSGAGGRLLDVAVADAHRRDRHPVLDVVRTRPDIAAFYERRGWRRVGEGRLPLRHAPGEVLEMWLYAGPRPVDVGAVEAAASRAMPAAEVARLGDWLLRSTSDVGARRANSVLANGRVEPEAGDEGGGLRLGLDARIDAVERFYAGRDRPARFQLTPVSRPDGLEAALRRRGYERKAPTLVMTGGAAGVGAAVLPVELAAVPDRRWLSTWCGARGADPVGIDGPRALWERIPAARAHATAFLDGEPAGAGMAVSDGRYVGIFNMAIWPHARRRGVATAALAALVAWGREQGADTAYLQVDVANAGARALYEAAGLRVAYEYAYLVRESPDS